MLKFLRMLLLLFFLLAAQKTFAQQSEPGEFDKFINNDTDGSSFDQSVVLDNACDYSKCKTKDCLLDVFNKTVFGQELQYVSDNYGQRGEDWEVTGYDSVAAYVFDDDKYYDDLGIQIMGTGQIIVLHFDITSPVNVFEEKKFNFKQSK
ncbi:MAG: hypothetical protein HY761_00630 [Candidatus Omnitrophica bacterium]|nr:hypothetical protein [Candidatus Omnitrophota bacterium]